MLLKLAHAHGKLAIGTAQFGIRYGVANTSGQVSASEARAILARAAETGVDTLDTAVAYGESEAVLGEIGVEGWQIITKLPPLPSEVEDCKSWVLDQLSCSLRRLRTAQISGLLLHRSGDLLGPHGQAYRSALSDIKRDGIAKVIGVSIYSPTELDALWPFFRPDLVQAPFNVLDRRLESSGWLARLASEGIRVHTRSAFLQGLLLMPPGKWPAYFQPWFELLDCWHRWVQQTGLTPLAAALGYCLGKPSVERIVVGINSLRQLDEILEAAELTAPSPPAFLSSEDRGLIEPSQWKL